MDSTLRQYEWIGPLYDLLSLEPVYRPGRLAAVDALRLAPGAQVLDVGCGTGLNFPHLLERVGPQGRVVGVDASAGMLRQAERRARSAGWANVTLVQADATELEAGDVRGCFPGGRADAALATYLLSLVPRWPHAWLGMLQLTRPGGRLAVADMGLPRGVARPLAPLARLACRLGGSDPGARPWTRVESDCDDVTGATLRGGHLEVRAGTRRSVSP